jgi:hypothetical protein
MNPKVAELLAMLDAGDITPQNADEAIQQAGGLTFILLNLALP